MEKRKPGRPASPPKEALEAVIAKPKYEKVALRAGAHPQQQGDPPEKFHGYVNKHGVGFRAGKYEEFGCHVSTRGDVVIKRCPKCHELAPYATEAIKGICANEDCNYSALAALDEIED